MRLTLLNDLAVGGCGIKGCPWEMPGVFVHLTSNILWEVIVVRAKAGIGYHGVACSIPPFDLPTLSVAGEGEVTITIKH